MKINWAYLKKPSVIVGALLLFFVLLFMLNRGSSKAASQTVVNTGPTDAQMAQQTQLALAQMSAGLQGQAIQVDYAKSQDQNATALALAGIQAQMGNNQLAAETEISNRTIDAQTHGLDLQYQTALDQNQFALDYAGQQFAYGLASQSITANTQLQLSEEQLKAFTLSTDAQLVMGLAGRNKYSSIALPAFFSTQAANGSSGQAPSTTITAVGGLH